jgi:hypothetical protein
MNKFKIKIIIKPNYNIPYNDDWGQMREFFKVNLCEFALEYDNYNHHYVVYCILTEEQFDDLPGKDSPHLEIIKEEYKTSGITLTI